LLLVDIDRKNAEEHGRLFKMSASRFSSKRLFYNIFPGLAGAASRY